MVILVGSYNVNWKLGEIEERYKALAESIYSTYYYIFT